ncbi:phospholipase [Lithospermum erythrorhizon]|uniref:Phospholipase n=1 Tax=Lithospermum erythrorhizon TaxID=34254 RepID=A0AAV3P8Y2_LITER
MEATFTTTFRPLPPPQLPSSHLPFTLLPTLTKNSTLTHSRTYKKMTIMALNKPRLEGVSDELNSIASQNMDFAPARRRVRAAFVDVQEQLDHILFKMAPKDIRMEEWYEINEKGQEIFCKCWLPKPGVRIKGALCFCHGYGDTCTFFFEGIAKHIAAFGYGVYAIDHPGFGLSEGLHGYVPEFDGIVDNVIEQYSRIKGRPEIVGLPHFLFGQSMGGAIALKTLLKEPHAWDGIVLVAPMVKIAEELTPPLPLQKLLIFLSRLMPKAKLVPQKDLAELAFREFKKRNMTPFNVISYSDPTRLKTAVELLNATKYLESNVDKVSSPILIVHGAADKVTDPEISQYLYKNASSIDKTLKLYDDGHHSILEGEPDDRILTVLTDIISWLDARCLAR